jgi:glutamine synthetase
MSEPIIPIKNFLEIPYDKLEELNTTAEGKRDIVSFEEQEKEYRAYLEKETRIKAVTVCFSDLEGRFHMLDYDKKFLLSSSDNLTFDGSSIRGFTAQSESDLRLHIDWTSFYWLPSDLFGPGKVIVFGNILNREGKQYESDFRGLLQNYLRQLKEKEGLTVFASAEIEGFLLEGLNAEQRFEARAGFGLVTTGGYFHSLPKGPLRQFIDASAEAQRAMGFRNEKDHPEVAPSQFEMNFSYSAALRACDHIQLYKLVCRTAAYKMGMTACFLPKPLMGINGSGMHTNLSLAKKGKNIFYDKNGKEKLSPVAWDFVSRILNHAPEMCLVLNSSVNAYRRLDPKFEAPNQIKVSPIDRGSMIRIPVGNERTSRIEIRSVAPDANPYLLLYTIIQAGLKGSKLPVNDKRDRVRLLPGTIYDAIKLFKQSDFMKKILGEMNAEKYADFKQAVADRSPKELGNQIKTSEIIYHHEVTNQALWNTF